MTRYLIILTLALGGLAIHQSSTNLKPVLARLIDMALAIGEAVYSAAADIWNLIEF